MHSAFIWEWICTFTLMLTLDPLTQETWNYETILVFQGPQTRKFQYFFLSTNCIPEFFFAFFLESYLDDLQDETKRFQKIKNFVHARTYLSLNIHTSSQKKFESIMIVDLGQHFEILMKVGKRFYAFLYKSFYMKTSVNTLAVTVGLCYLRNNSKIPKVQKKWKFDLFKFATSFKILRFQHLCSF